jgi:hypothetical protein
VLGATGPGGGIVFYVNPVNTPGSNYMEAATADLTTLESWCSNTTTPITGTYLFDTAIGTGNANTNLMVAGGACTSGVAVSARAYGTATAPAGNWFLPSKDELNELYRQRAVVGGFAAAAYWSSSQVDPNNAWIQRFDNGLQNGAGKSLSYGVRPVRAF